MLIDENAFGILIAFYDIEDVEYALSPVDFADRFSEFRSAVLGAAAEAPLGTGTSVLDLGHALYFEIADGDQAMDPMAWLKRVKEALAQHEFALTFVITHGGRWLSESAPLPEILETGGYRLTHATRPSEPLRRALYAETATHGSDGSDGWGAGTYVDTEAVEALGKSPKNAPTPLSAAGATFYRMGR